MDISAAYGNGYSAYTSETYQYQVNAGAIKQRFPQAVKSDTIKLPDRTGRRDVFERSDSNRFFTGGYDALSSEEIKSLKYRIEHTISHNSNWFGGEAAKDLQEIKEEKGYYTDSDILNAYGFTYARLYAEIEQRYENGDEQWFGLGGEPLTKEKEIEELNMAYEGAVAWTTKCAEIMADLQNANWTPLFGPAQNDDKTASEVSSPEQKGPGEMKHAFYEAWDKYMELYKSCRQTGNPLMRQDYVFGHNALLAFLAKTWSGDTNYK